MLEIPTVLIGHKDHGKSTLIGRLLLDTKSIKESRYKEVQEVDEASGYKFELAHLVDSFKEEREREMTMDTTRAVLKGKERNYQLIDVPGHSELISNMLTGAAGAEAALLLVSIDEGIKEQTRQHLEIAKLLGIEQLGVVVNKIDKINYQKEKFDEITGRLKEILNNIGYVSENINFFPVSAWKGDNVVKKSEKTPWYQGKTVMEFLEEEVELPKPFDNLPLAFLIQDKDDNIFMGRVESGKLKKGQKVLIIPGKKIVEVAVIKDSDGELEEANSGQNIGVEILKKGNFEASRGTALVSEDSSMKEGNILSGEMFWIKKPSQEKLSLECGTARVEAELREPKEINQGEKTLYKISLEKVIAFEPRSKTILGKLVLKDNGKIIAVGNIV